MNFAECEKTVDRIGRDRDYSIAGDMRFEEDRNSVAAEGDSMSFVRKDSVPRKFESWKDLAIEVRMCLQNHPLWRLWCEFGGALFFRHNSAVNEEWIQHKC